MDAIEIEIANEEDMRAFGERLARVLPDGMVVTLDGTLGAGKTRLVQAVAVACGIAEGTVVSPTFVLMQSYAGDRAIHHFDAYRIKDDDEFLELGPDESFESAGLTFIEWADRVVDCLPPDRLAIKIEVTSQTSRQLKVVGTGERSQSVSEELGSGWQR